MPTVTTLLDRVNYPIAFALGIAIFLARDGLLGTSTRLIDNADGWHTTAWRNFTLSLDPRELRQSMDMVIRDKSTNFQMHLLMPRTPTPEELYWGLPVYDRYFFTMRTVCAVAAMALALVWYTGLEFVLPRLKNVFPSPVTEKAKSDEKAARDVEDKEPEYEQQTEGDRVSTWRAIFKTLLDVTLWRFVYEVLCLWIRDAMIKKAAMKGWVRGENGRYGMNEVHFDHRNVQNALLSTAEAFASVATVISYMAFKRLPPAPRAVAFAATPLVQLAVKTILWAVIVPTLIGLSPIESLIKEQTEQIWVAEQARMAWEEGGGEFPEYGHGEL